MGFVQVHNPRVREFDLKVEFDNISWHLKFFKIYVSGVLLNNVTFELSNFCQKSSIRLLLSIKPLSLISPSPLSQNLK